MITSAVYLVGCVIYWFWASGEVQPWAQQSVEISATDTQTDARAEKRTIASNGYVNQAIELEE